MNLQPLQKVQFFASDRFVVVVGSIALTESLGSRNGIGAFLFLGYLQRLFLNCHDRITMAQSRLANG